MSDKRVTVWVQEFKDRKSLVLQWIDPLSGRRKSKSAGTSNAKEAEQARADLEYELNHGKYQEGSNISWERFRESFESEHLVGLREQTRIKYGFVLDVFEEIIDPKKLRNVNERVISRFVQGMRARKCSGGKIGLSPHTIKGYLIHLKAVLGWAVKQKLLPSLPAFPAIKVPKKKPQPISTDDFERLLAVAPDDRWRAFLLCGWWGGLRLSEASHLHWEPSETLPWIDLENNRIVLPAVFAKSAEDQWIPLHPILREGLEALPCNDRKVFPFQSEKTKKPLTRSGITNRVLAFAKKAGVKLSMHKLRKGFGCRVAKQLGKGGAAMLHELMRHSSMQVTMDYYASVDDALQDAIQDLT